MFFLFEIIGINHMNIFYQSDLVDVYSLPQLCLIWYKYLYHFTHFPCQRTALIYCQDQSICSYIPEKVSVN